MKEFFFNTIQEFNDFIGVETLHPLVSVARVENRTPIQEAVNHYGLYALFLKENKGCKLSYGRTEYDFDEMTVTSFTPGQSIKVEPIPGVPFAKYTVLAFHPDLLNRTQLGKNISRYEFFDYTSNEALHLSAAEVNIFRDVLTMIKQELQHPIDKHSRELIVSNIELLLNYCLRFYDRQFITREEINHSVVKKFISLLDEYIAQKAEHEGLPTVAYFADKCCYSTKYFGELVKTETGRTAKSIIIKDDVNDIMQKVLNADVVCWATPIYYYEMSGQMKTLIDRMNAMYSLNYKFREVYMLSTAAENEPEVPKRAEAGLTGWIDCYPESHLAGTLFCGGVDAPRTIEGNKKLQEAYELGKSV